MRQENFEETQRRLGLQAGSTTQQPKKSNSGLIVGIVGGLLVLGGAALSAFLFLPSLGIGSDEWTDYPGTWFEESNDVLAADSLEVTQAKGDQLLADLTTSLADYGFEWSVLIEGKVDASSNGYDGTSMLQEYTSDVLVGQVTLDDPDARADIIQILSDAVSAPGVTVVIDNDSITDDDAEYFFGSHDRDAQALWSAWSYDEHFTDLAADFTVYDSTVATGEDFPAVFWAPSDSNATVFVRISVSADYLLSESDREAFIDALEPYEGKTKPDYRG